MAVTAEDLILFKPKTVSDTPNLNGGPRSYNEVPQSAAENLFNHVFTKDRLDGLLTVRYAYASNLNTNKEKAQNVKVWIDNETPAGDYVYFTPRPQGDLQSNIPPSITEIYTVANLKTDVSAGDTVVTVTCPSVAEADTYNTILTSAFKDQSQLRITNKLYPDSSVGTTEFGKIEGVPTVAGNDVTFTLSKALENDFTVVSGTRVSTEYITSSISATFSTPTVTSPSGTVNVADYPPILENDSSIEEVWTLTFLDNTNFTCEGAVTGNLVAGKITEDYAPVNPTKTKPYFKLEPGFWGGTFAVNDKVVIPTHDSSENIAFIRIVPKDTPPFGSDRCTVGVSCESVDA